MTGDVHSAHRLFLFLSGCPDHHRSEPPEGGAEEEESFGMGEKMKLYGFNNLTKALSFNIYDVCYAKRRGSSRIIFLILTNSTIRSV